MSILKILFNFLIFPGFAFIAIFGLFLTWVDRKITARVQWRVGPPIYQPYADFLKLLLKEVLIPEGACKLLFILAPLLGVAALTIVGIILFFVSHNPKASFVGDLIVVVYLFALPPLAVILGGSTSENPLSAVGASREMNLYFGYELPFIFSLLVPVIKTGSIKIGDIIIYQNVVAPFLYSFSGAISFIIALICMQAKMGFVPFDIPEAEQEIMAGPYLEYSGVLLGMFKLTKAMMLFLLPIFLIIIFWGGIGDLWVIPKFLFLLVIIVILKNTNPRLRIDQALKFFWIPLTILGIIAVILAFSKL